MLSTTASVREYQLETVGCQLILGKDVPERTVATLRAPTKWAWSFPLIRRVVVLSSAVHVSENRRHGISPQELQFGPIESHSLPQT